AVHRQREQLPPFDRLARAGTSELLVPALQQGALLIRYEPYILVVDTLLQQAGRKLLDFQVLPRFGRAEQQSLPDGGEEQFSGSVVVDPGTERIMEPGPEALMLYQAAQEPVGGGTPVIAACRFDDRRKRASARDTPQERSE